MLPRNKEIKKKCCEQPINFTLQPYTDGSAELKCKLCGHIIKAFDAPVNPEDNMPFMPLR